MKPVVDLATSCDLSMASFMWAATRAGYLPLSERYVLTVHPKMQEVAEHILRCLYAEPYRWQERVELVTHPFASSDDWTIEGKDAVVRGSY